MPSTDYNSTYYPSTGIHLLEQSFTPANIPSDLHTFLPEISAAVTAQFNFDPLDMPSLPALMSPGSSMNEFSESIDGREEEEDDDDLDEYEIFTTPRHRTSANGSHANNSANVNVKQYQLECSNELSMVFDSGFPSLSIQHPFHSHSHYGLPNTSGPMYSEFQQPHMIYHQQQPQQHALIPEAQRLQSLPAEPQQQQQSMYASNFIQHLQQPFIPSAPLHEVPTISVEQVPNPQAYVESGVLNYYLSSREPRQQQSSPLSTLESSLNLLLTPNVSNFSSISNSSFAQSPAMSWVSIESSRPASPEHQHQYQNQQQQAFPSHVAVSQNNSNNKRPRPTKKHSVPHYRKVKYIVTERHASTAAEGDIPAITATVTVAGEDSTRVKRKRRARQTKPKVKPTSYSCDVPDCGKVFSRAYNLTSHMKTHSAERPFLCDSCPLAFARRHDRERHVRLHTGEKPYNCQSCGSGFMRNDALHRHQRICGQSALTLAALLQQNSSIGQEDAAAAASLEGLDTSNVYQNIFEL